MRAVIVVVLCVALAGCAPDVVLSPGDGDDPSPSGSEQPQQLGPPAGKPYIRGTVRVVTPTVPVTENCGPADPDGDGAVSSNDPPVCNPDPDHDGSFLVVGGGGGGEDKAVVSVPEGTGIARRKSNGTLVAAAFGDLAKGGRVSVWITGDVAESYPVQVTATFVLLES